MANFQHGCRQDTVSKDAVELDKKLPGSRFDISDIAGRGVCRVPCGHAQPASKLSTTINVATRSWLRNGLVERQCRGVGFVGVGG